MYFRSGVYFKLVSFISIYNLFYQNYTFYSKMRFDYLLSLVGLNQMSPADSENVWDLGDKPMSIENLAMAGFPIDKLVAKAEDNEFLGGPGKGEVTYSQCDDDAGVFTLDDSATTNSPEPVVVPCNETFHL